MYLNTTASLRITLAVAPTTPLEYVFDYADRDGAFAISVIGLSQGTISSATGVDVVVAPGSNTRQVLRGTLYNADASTCQATVARRVSGTDYEVAVISLPAGYTLAYTGDEWLVKTAAGIVLTAQQAVGGSGYPAYQHVNGGASLQRSYCAAMVNATALTTGAPSVGTLRALPFVSPARTSRLDQLWFEVTTLLAGNGRIGLYANSADTSLYPGVLLFDSGSISTGTTGVKSATLSVTLEPGRVYWLAYESDSAATLRCLPVAACYATLGMAATGGSAPGIGISVTHTYGALPNPFTNGGSVISATPIPALCYRIGS